MMTHHDCLHLQKYLNEAQKIVMYENLLLTTLGIMLIRCDLIRGGNPSAFV